MPQKTSSFSEIKYGWNLGENGWNDGADENWLKQGFWIESLVDGIVGSLPSAVNGQAFYLTTDNRVYVYVEGSWRSFPVPKWGVVKLRATGETYQFNGTSINQIQTTSEISQELVNVQGEIDSLGSAAFQNTEFFATSSSLDVVEAQVTNYIDTVVSDFTSTDLDKGAVRIGRSAVYINSISEMLSIPASGRSINHVYVVESYYGGWAVELPYIGPRGGGLFVWDADSVAEDNGVTVFEVSGVAAGRWRRVLRNGTVSLWDAGCVTTAGVDNHDRILAALYCEADVVHVPGYQFDTTPLEVGLQANGKSLLGVGIDSCLSMIGEVTKARALLHIPKVGDAYNGSVAGAQNFTIDNIRLRGDQHTGAFSTTGLVAYDAVNLQIGTLWSHGFYKSGMLFGGSPTRINVGRYYGYNNGNHPTSSTGGQGFAIVSDVDDYPAIHVEYAECWSNGINNFGQGLDMVRGNFTAGTLVFHDNGA